MNWDKMTLSKEDKVNRRLPGYRMEDEWVLELNSPFLGLKKVEKLGF